MKHSAALVAIVACLGCATPWYTGRKAATFDEYMVDGRPIVVTVVERRTTRSTLYTTHITLENGVTATYTLSDEYCDTSSCRKTIAGEAHRQQRALLDALRMHETVTLCGDHYSGGRLDVKAVVVRDGPVARSR